MRNKTFPIVIVTAVCTGVFLFMCLAAVILFAVVGASAKTANDQRQHDKAQATLSCVGDNIKSSTTRQCTSR
jgi:type IV secretory pathway VirB6-like protein